METPIFDLPTISAGHVLALAVPIFALVFGAEMVKSAKRSFLGTIVLVVLGASLLTNCGGMRTRAEAGLTTIRSVEPSRIDAILNDPDTVRSAIVTTQSVVTQLAAEPGPGNVVGVDTPVTVVVGGQAYDVTAEQLPLLPMNILRMVVSGGTEVKGVTITRSDLP